MKKILLLAVLCFSLTSVSAQKVYRRILSQSQQVAMNKEMNLDLRKIAQFKVDALNYLATKTKELKPDTPIGELDKQAYALNEFVTCYINELTKYTSKKARAYVLTVFRDATNTHTRFGDMDRDLVLSYYNNKNYLTQFSLDTDWEKALAEVKKELNLK
jgi:hypothetical protein